MESSSPLLEAQKGICREICRNCTGNLVLRRLKRSLEIAGVGYGWLFLFKKMERVISFVPIEKSKQSVGDYIS